MLAVVVWLLYAGLAVFDRSRAEAGAGLFMLAAVITYSILCYRHRLWSRKRS